MNIKLTGIVVTGLAEGRTLGFPTANLKITQGERPRPGVYFVRIKKYDSGWLTGLLISGVYWEEPNIPRVEVYLLDFSGNLYGQELAVEVLEFVRDIIKTTNTAKLKDLIQQDIKKAVDYFTANKIIN
ncbi:MAG: riboflavin kinase [Patescibacteria group bacterium]